MSLDFDVSGIENYREVTTLELENGKLLWHPVTTSIIHLCIPIQLGKITKENWKKWFARCRLWESAFGPMIIREEGWEGEKFITPEEVTAHIGLTTNVLDATDAKWRKDFMESWQNEVEWRILKDYK